MPVTSFRARHVRRAHTKGNIHQQQLAFCGSRRLAQNLLFSQQVLCVHLTRKYAECINDVDLSTRRVGDFFELPKRAASLLIAEGWAEAVERRLRKRPSSADSDDERADQSARRQ